MDSIERLLKLFRDEVITACWAFFVWKTINNMASGDPEVHKALNENAVSWNIITHSLQNTFFVTLGRIFDVDGNAFSIHAFLRACIENIGQFSVESLRERKLRDAKSEIPDWLGEYLSDAYVPCESDFQRLRGETSKRQKQYEEIYRPIRNKIIAHKEQQTIETADDFFGKTSIGQIEEILNFLFQVQSIIFQLFFNGRLCSIGDFTFDEDNYVQDDVEGMLRRLKSQPVVSPDDCATR